MKFGLEDEVIERICEVFAEFPEVEEVTLFGSRAKGNYRPGSDIDMVLKGRKLTTSLLHKISVRLDELLLTNMFNIGLYSRINEKDLLDHITQVGTTFYKRAASDG